MRRLARMLAVALAPAVAACDMMPDWLGEAEERRLEGERIPVLSIDTAPRADPSIADLAVRLPRPRLNAEWPQVGGYADHAMHHVAAPGPLARLWIADIGAGASDEQRMLSPPVVGGGRIFALDSEGAVSAFRADNGQRLWRVGVVPEEEEDEAIGGGVAYGGGRLFVATGVGELVALDAATSGEIWRTRVGAPIRAAPAYSNGRVFAVTYDNRLHALDAADGRLLWSHSGVAEEAQLLAAATPAVSGGLVVAAYSSGDIYALRVENGGMAWTDTLAFAGRFGPLASLGDINGSPVIDRELVYAVSHAGRLVAISLRSGERLWEQGISGVQTPWIAGDFLYLLTTEGNLVCLSRIDGLIRWIQSLPRYTDPEDREGPIFWSGPLLASDRLIVVGSHGEAISISPYSGRFLGRLTLPGGVELAPIAANGTVFILTNDGELVALR